MDDKAVVLDFGRGKNRVFDNAQMHIPKSSVDDEYRQK